MEIANSFHEKPPIISSSRLGPVREFIQNELNSYRSSLTAGKDRKERPWDKLLNHLNGNKTQGMIDERESVLKDMDKGRTEKVISFLVGEAKKMMQMKSVGEDVDTESKYEHQTSLDAAANLRIELLAGLDPEKASQLREELATKS